MVVRRAQDLRNHPALVGHAHAELFAKLFKTAAHAPDASLSFRFIVSQQCRAHRPFPLAATPVTYPLPANEASPSAAAATALAQADFLRQHLPLQGIIGGNPRVIRSEEHTS